MSNFSNVHKLVDGELTIQFKKTLSINDMVSFLSKNNLKPTSEIYNSRIFKILSDDAPNSSPPNLNYYIKQLSTKNIVSKCKISSAFWIECELNPTMPLQAIETAVSEIGNMSLDIKAVLTVGVEVPVGTEQEWVNKLKKYSEIELVMQTFYW
ncbi:MAG: hypothetical protein ABR875_01325 [Minisyncoccia bacterium]|jgi:hypothetical protein